MGSLAPISRSLTLAVWLCHQYASEAETWVTWYWTINFTYGNACERGRAKLEISKAPRGIAEEVQSARWRKRAWAQKHLLMNTRIPSALHRKIKQGTNIWPQMAWQGGGEKRSDGALAIQACSSCLELLTWLQRWSADIPWQEQYL